jgi:hypothetical protein
MKMWCTHMMDCPSALKSKELLTQATVWITLEDTG